MGVIYGLAMGIGVFLVWWSCWSMPQGTVRTRREPKIVVTLRKAGMHTVTPSAFTGVSILSGVLAGVLLFALTGLWSFAFLGTGGGFIQLPRVVSKSPCEST